MQLSQEVFQCPRFLVWGEKRDEATRVMWPALYPLIKKKPVDLDPRQGKRWEGVEG